MDGLPKELVRKVALSADDGVTVGRWMQVSKRYMVLLGDDDSLWEDLCQLHFGWRGLEVGGNKGLQQYVCMRRGHAVAYEHRIQYMGGTSAGWLCDAIRFEGESFQKVAPSGHWPEWRFIFNIGQRSFNFPEVRGLLNALKLHSEKAVVIASSLGVAWLPLDAQDAGSIFWPLRFETRHNKCLMIEAHGVERVFCLFWHFYSDSGATILCVEQDRCVWRTELSSAGVGHSEYEHACALKLLPGGKQLCVESVGSYARWVEVIDVEKGNSIKRRML